MAVDRRISARLKLNSCGTRLLGLKKEGRIESGQDFSNVQGKYIEPLIVVKLCSIKPSIVFEALNLQIFSTYIKYLPVIGKLKPTPPIFLYTKKKEKL